jgi:hypothetical protein
MKKPMAIACLGSALFLNGGLRQRHRVLHRLLPAFDLVEKAR